MYPAKAEKKMNESNQESSHSVQELILKLYNCTLEYLKKETFDVAYVSII